MTGTPLGSSEYSRDIERLQSHFPNAIQMPCAVGAHTAMNLKMLAPRGDRSRGNRHPACVRATRLLEFTASFNLEPDAPVLITAGARHFADSHREPLVRVAAAAIPDRYGTSG